MVIGCFQMPQEPQEIRIFFAAARSLCGDEKRRGCPRRLDLIASVRRF
jgi:hypothetical protein